MYCIKCRFELPNDAAFCLSCGSPQKSGGGARRPAPTVDTEVFRVTDSNKCTCIVKSSRIVIQNKNGSMQQFLYRDITSVNTGGSKHGIFGKPCVWITVGVDTFPIEIAVFKKKEDAEALSTRVQQLMQA